MFAADSQLSRVQYPIAPTVLACFRDGREIRGMMLPGHGRPPSSKCEAALIAIRQKELKFQQWNLYHKRLPRPKATALQQMLSSKYGRFKLANHYLEHMEIGMLTMMRDQCKRLLAKVESHDRVVGG